MGPRTVNFVPPPVIGTDGVALPKFDVRWLRRAESSPASSKPIESSKTPDLLGFFSKYANFPAGMVIRLVSRISPALFTMNRGDPVVPLAIVSHFADWGRIPFAKGAAVSPTPRRPVPKACPES